MTRKNTKTLKIKVDAYSLSASDLKDLQQWENEGGQPGPRHDFLQSLSPISYGQIFEVVGGDFHIEDGTIIYEADIKILALP